MKKLEKRPAQRKRLRQLGIRLGRLLLLAGNLPGDSLGVALVSTAVLVLVRLWVRPEGTGSGKSVSLSAWTTGGGEEAASRGRLARLTRSAVAVSSVGVASGPGGGGAVGSGLAVIFFRFFLTLGKPVRLNVLRRRAFLPPPPAASGAFGGASTAGVGVGIGVGGRGATASTSAVVGFFLLGIFFFLRLPPSASSAVSAFESPATTAADARLRPPSGADPLRSRDSANSAFVS